VYTGAGVYGLGVLAGAGVSDGVDVYMRLGGVGLHRTF
jgi:hypothetical protein